MGWAIGFGIGGAVVLIVVVLLVTLIATARKIGDQARDIRTSLDEAYDNTLGLWEVEAVNDRVTSITGGLAEARKALGGGG